VVGKDGGIDAPWPPGVRVDTFDHLPRETRDAVLIDAMTRTYEDTMDCPELCGLRETADVLESHRAAGRFDPAMWFIVYWHDQPHGCMLLNRAPESRSVELVYVGLSPELRGKGLASRLLRIGINRCRGAGDWLTCAVDRRNTPALWLYQRQGFLTVSERRAFVRPVPRG
jgi:ribosomal protein S18 acetylase RimI-like enzyme